jgi:hypothetical protein
VDTSGTGFGGVAGIYGGHGDWSGGLSYQSRSKLAFEGWADFETPPELSRSARDQPVRTTVTLPDRLVLGAAWRGLADLTVSADLELTLWSTVDALVVTFEDEAMAPLEDQRRWRTTVTPAPRRHLPGPGLPGGEGRPLRGPHPGAQRHRRPPRPPTPPGWGCRWGRACRRCRG